MVGDMRPYEVYTYLPSELRFNFRGEWYEDETCLRERFDDVSNVFPCKRKRDESYFGMNGSEL